LRYEPSFAFNFFWPDSDEKSAKISSYPDRLKSRGFVLSAVLQISWQKGVAHLSLLRRAIDLKEGGPTLAPRFS
jgi:hypothetical protein